jgi:DNA mismatch repair protein MutH
MKLETAYNLIKNIKNKNILELIKSHNTSIKEVKINKGGVGQLLLQYLNLPLDSKLKDFEDGELKTNKTDKNGKSKETIFITQISKIIDELVCDKPKIFKESNLYHKINNLLFIGICKDDDNFNKWFFTNCYHISSKKDSEIYAQLELDYYSICGQLVESIKKSKDKFIHTANGKYIQIRSKDSKPYHPIYSKIFKKDISNKNHAFYFKKEFMEYVKSKY